MRKTSAVLVFAAVSLAVLAPRAGAVVAPGQVAPNFTKTDLDGNVHSLSDYLGKVVLIFETGWD